MRDPAPRHREFHYLYFDIPFEEELLLKGDTLYQQLPLAIPWAGGLLRAL